MYDEKVVGLVMSVILLVVCTVSPVHALDTVEMDGYMEESRVLTIERLEMERNRLCHDIETNADAIQRIDYQLGILGVEDLTQENMPETVGTGADISANVPATNYHVKWTTWRTIYVYRGTQYEIQVIRSKSNADLDYSSYPKIYDEDPFSDTGSFDFKDESDYGIEVALIEAVKFSSNYVGTKFYEGVLETTTILAPGLQIVYDIIDSLYFLNDYQQLVKENLSPTTEIRNTSIGCVYSLVSAVEYIYVKVPGTADEGNQICAYIGNEVECSAGISGATFKRVYTGGEYVKKPLIVQDVVSVVYSSPNFLDRHRFAVENYVNYRNGYTIDITHLANHFTLTLQSHLINRTDNSKQIPIPYILDYSLF